MVREKGAHWAAVGWNIPPESDRNGIIITYNIIVEVLDRDPAVVWNETVAVQDLTIDSHEAFSSNVTNLKPLTGYQWSVAAATTAGAGPFTPSAIFFTMEWSELCD